MHWAYLWNWPWILYICFIQTILGEEEIFQKKVEGFLTTIQFLHPSKYRIKVHAYMHVTCDSLNHMTNFDLKLWVKNSHSFILFLSEYFVIHILCSKFGHAIIKH